MYVCFGVNSNHRKSLPCFCLTFFCLIMATNEHLKLAQFIKEVHSKLRKSSMEMGPKEAWRTHCENRDILKKYAHFMEELATTHWERNCASSSSSATSRLQWVADFCHDYFTMKGFNAQQRREMEIAHKINVLLEVEEIHSNPIKLIDVGSCYNPFRMYEYLEVTAIDICPANDTVYECDFLNVFIGTKLELKDMTIYQLPQSYYDVVTFCFLLEYIPTSDLRLKACENAYNILNGGGVLIITTPDSKHVGANSKIMKCWQYTLARMGFMRIKYEKLKHMHCMAFRKALCKDTAVRWAKLHEQPYMEYGLHIPQDYNTSEELVVPTLQTKVEPTLEDFKELPFSD